MIVELALIVVGAGAAGYLLRRRRKKKAKEAAAKPPPRRSGDVRVGDALLYMGADYVVNGELIFSEEGQVFRLYAVTDGKKDRWLLVEEGQPGLRSLLDEASGLDLAGSAPETVPHRGVSYRMRKRGVAQATSQGEVSRLGPGQYEYYRYAAPGRQVLMALRREAETTALSGEEIMPGALEILPGQT